MAEEQGEDPSLMSMESDRSTITYDRFAAPLGLYSPPSPSPDYTAAFLTSGIVPAPVVLRRVILDDASCPPLHAEENTELEYLSLSLDKGDEFDEEKKDLASSVPSPIISSTPQGSSSTQNPPWYCSDMQRPISIRSPLLELHQEIVDFCDFISPTQEEQQSRAMAVERVSNIIRSIWRQCQVVVFGSFATGLYLPSSDIDMVILDSGCCDPQSGLKALAIALTNEGVAQSIQVIGKARVPIVKFVETQSLISFDVSFDMQNGPEAAKFIQDALKAVPPLKPLCLILKIFLQQRDLNEVYNGGIGSYALLVMLLAYLQTHARKVGCSYPHQETRLEQNLGVLLVEFFEFYGKHLNTKTVGISCRNGGQFFQKRERGFFDSRKPFLLSVEDPQTPSNDIAKNSYNFHKVRFAFMLAHKALTDYHCLDSARQVSLLARIVRVDEKLMSRKTTVPVNSEGMMHYFSCKTGDITWHENFFQRSQFDNHTFTEEGDFPRGGVDMDNDTVRKKFKIKKKRKHKVIHRERDLSNKKTKKRSKKRKENDSLEEPTYRKHMNAGHKVRYDK